MTPPTEEQRREILSSLRIGIALDKAARAMGTTAAACVELAGRDPQWAADMAAAEREGEAAEVAPVAVPWAAVMAASAERQREEAGEAKPAPAVTPRKVKAVDADGFSEDADASPGDADLIAREAAQFDPGPFGFYLWLDSKCVAHGFPATSLWWKHTIKDFYESGKRWLVVEAGRGAGKSTTLTRFASTENMFARRNIPPGQRWIWPFISVTVPDARRRIVEIQAILRAIGVNVEPKYPQGQPTIEMVDIYGNAIAFVAQASTIAGVSGPSTTGATIDEEAKLRDKATNANPSTEIIASLLQTFRARPGIRAIRCSSAWETQGSHYAAVTEGDTGATRVARIGETFFPAAWQGFLDVAQWEEQHGNREAGNRVRAYLATLTADSPAIPTWLGNPTISAIASREDVDAIPTEALGGVPKIVYWLRENGSVPTAPGATDDDSAEARAQIMGLAERRNERRDKSARAVQQASAAPPRRGILG